MRYNMYINIIKTQCVSVCVCVSVRGNKKSEENLLVNVVYLFICCDY